MGTAPSSPLSVLMRRAHRGQSGAWLTPVLIGHVDAESFVQQREIVTIDCSWEEFYPDFVDKAAVLLVRLARNHPLPDGNKRVAWDALVHRDQRLVMGNATGRARLCERAFHSYAIFEGTSEIQRLVIARAISGLHNP
jgi:alkylation response protein AidB-like acyl-CoA dehydrogenase